MTFLSELRDRFTAALKEAEDIRLKYQGKPETMTAEEEERWAKLMDEADHTKTQIETGEREEALKKWSADSAGMIPLTSGLPAPPAPEPGDPTATKAGVTTEQQKVKATAWSSFLRTGIKGLDAAGIKALQADSGVLGGYLVAPEQFVTELIQIVRDMVFMRRLGRVITMEKAESLGVPTLEAHPADADWTQELGTGSEDSTMAFGKRELTPHPVAKRIKVSNKLLRQSSINVDALVRDLLGYKFGITEEKAFLTGTGNNQPLGIFTADANGIPTSRDVAAAATTSFTGDDLIGMKYSLKMQYHARARWIFHRDVLKMARRLKDGQGNYIWASGLGPGGGLQGTPPTLVEMPYEVSEYAPNTFTTGLYLAVLGDFSFYWIVDALDMQLQVLDQLYAETNQTGYIGRKETDGMPVLSESFARLKLA